MKMNTVKRLGLSAWAALAFLALIAGVAGPPAQAEGKEMPGVIVLKYLQNKYRPVTFNHEVHASIAGSCGTCHHQHDDKARATCKECHALSEGAFKASVKHSFAACSSCHSDPSPDMPEMPGLKVAFHKKCFQCHVGIGDLGASPGACVKTCHAKK
jgi:hypothetical protein